MARSQGFASENFLRLIDLLVQQWLDLRELSILALRHILELSSCEKMSRQESP